MTNSVEKNEKKHELIKNDGRYEKLEKFLKPSEGDRIHSGIETGLSVVPGFGGVLAKLFSLGVESPLEKRKREFLISLAIKLDNLEKKGRLNVSDFENNEEFNDLIIHGLEIAMKNSRKEKIQALQNILINSALKMEDDIDLRYVFLRTIDELTPIHIKILLEFRKAGLDLKTGEESVDRLKKSYEEFLSELVSRGLLEHHPDTGAILLETAEELPEYRITTKGVRFLDFIREYD